MGANTFEDMTFETTDPQKAYDRLVEQAEYEFGHEPYSGTIATTGGFRVVPGHKAMTQEQAGKLIEKRIDNLQKWGPCEALPLVEETPAQWEALGRRTVTLTLTRKQLSDRAFIYRQAAAQLGVTQEEVNYCAQTGVKVLKTKVQARAGQGARETRYFAVAAADGVRMPRWESGHPTQAAARAALSGLATGADPRAVEVVALTRRTGGAPLVSAEVSLAKVEVTLSVSLQRKVKDAVVGTEHAGWVFYGWAAS